MDTITGDVQISNAHGVFNAGTPIDANILIGQLEGGFLQGLAFSSAENPVIGENGIMFNTAFSDYHVPTALDIPNMSVEPH